MKLRDKGEAARNPRRARLVAALPYLCLFLLLGWTPLYAQYTLYGLGTQGGLATQPAAINDFGAVAGTLTGT